MTYILQGHITTATRFMTLVMLQSQQTVIQGLVEVETKQLLVQQIPHLHYHTQQWVQTPLQIM